MMTFTDMRDLLAWARDNRVASLEVGVATLETQQTLDVVPTLKATFYPEKPAPEVNLNASTPDWRKRVDAEMGLLGLGEEDRKQ